MGFNNYGCSLIFGHPQAPTAGRLIIEGIEETAKLGGRSSVGRMRRRRHGRRYGDKGRLRRKATHRSITHTTLGCVSRGQSRSLEIAEKAQRKTGIQWNLSNQRALDHSQNPAPASRVAIELKGIIFFRFFCSLLTAHCSLLPHRSPRSDRTKRNYSFCFFCSLLTVHCSLFFSVHCSLLTVFSVHCSLFTLHSSPFTLHYSPLLRADWCFRMLQNGFGRL